MEKQQITYKGNPIHLTVDLSTETLQARREWQNIFKVLKEKSTTKITVPSKDLIQNWWRNQKLFRQAKVKRIQYYQTSCEESWVPKNWCFWTVVLEKTLESPLDCKEVQPVHPKGDQS